MLNILLMTRSIEADQHSIFFRCVEDSDEAIMISNAKGVLVYVNPAWCRIYGFTKEEAIGQTPRLLHSGTQPDYFYRNMWAQIMDPQKGSWKGELINRAKDGTLVPVLLTITPYRRTPDEISGFMGIAVDMTFRRDLEAQIAHQDRLASIGTLASGLAHEIGTPLGVVRGRAEFLMMKAPDDFFKKNLEVITSEIDRISKIIRSLLRVSRSFSDVQMDNIHPHSVANDVLSLLGQKLREDAIELRNEIPEDLVVRADTERLSQVFLNLFMNAIYAIHQAKEDGRASPHSLTLGAAEAGATASIKVEDSGCGIPAENMRKLFKPFFTTKDIGEGTGLGLAIVAQLMREMDGEISVQSQVGKGTAFTLTLASRAEPKSAELS